MIKPVQLGDAALAAAKRLTPTPRGGKPAYYSQDGLYVLPEALKGIVWEPPIVGELVVPQGRVKTFRLPKYLREANKARAKVQPQPQTLSVIA